MKFFLLTIVALCACSVSCLRVKLPSLNHYQKNILIAKSSFKKPIISSLYAYEDFEDDSKPKVSLKVIAIAAVGGIGIFGTGFLTPINNLIKDAMGSSQQSIVAKDLKKGTTEPNRGSMTRLTRREINAKLEQVPIFFTYRGENAGVYASDGIGYFFIDKADADKYAAKNNLKVSATTLDDVYYTLIDKKTKMASYITGVSAKSDISAKYLLVPSEGQLKYMTSEWLTSHSNDIPLYRVPNLAFSKEEGLELPLFIQKEDALNAYTRLQESKKGKIENTDNTKQEEPTLQITSLKDLLALFSSGGFESRAFEFYPSMDMINIARSIITGNESE